MSSQLRHTKHAICHVAGEKESGGFISLTRIKSSVNLKYENEKRLIHSSLNRCRDMRIPRMKVIQVSPCTKPIYAAQLEASEAFHLLRVKGFI